jgi:perosamine synthetase
MPVSTEPDRNQLIVQIEPWIDESELRELKRVIDSTFIVEHEATREFERLTAELTGCKHAIAICNGTLALFASLKALGVGAGDEVIVPNFTFIASSNAVILAGATPVLCEVKGDTFCIDVARAKHLVTDRTKAVMPVHLYGQSADMGEVMAFADNYGLKVVEDAAEAIGVTFEGRHVGTFGDVGIISYYGNKTITCGEGGIVLTNDDDVAKAVYRLKNYGRERKGTFVHDTIGFNLSFTDLQAAIGLAQMKKMAAIVSKKRAIRDRYVDELSDLPDLRPVFVDPRCEPVFWFTSFLCSDPDALAKFLQAQNIQTRRFFYPLHLQPCYANCNIVKGLDGDFSVSESIYRCGISLPSYFRLSAEDQSYVVRQIKRFYADRH